MFAKIFPIPFMYIALSFGKNSIRCSLRFKSELELDFADKISLLHSRV